MRIVPLALPEVRLIVPTVRGDDRGAFHEAWHERRYHEAGLPERWVQDNVSRSRRAVLRGLHFQHPNDQAKLVSVLFGEILDVAVDIRRDSPTFGRAVSATLTAAGAEQLFVPAGFAHGFVVTSEEAVVMYKCTAYYAPECERAIMWNDPALAIEWPVATPILSERDARARRLADLAEHELPPFPS
ncbi:MAG TPA: dTDP-4-dehydrorhamnose 3,5-epimerase [Gemmatimonadaceae bacterium]|nr:dTDP-4-dehydrorhamnose 3,5-epimerase [Gemmatimonadaceae bacterium]